MLTTKAITLQKELQSAGLRDLPNEWTPESGEIWITAIILCTKSNGLQEYVFAVNDGNNKPIIKRDSGTPAAIKTFDRYFPVDKLEKKFVPELRSLKAQKEFLIKNGYPEADMEALFSKDGKTAEQVESDRKAIKEYINKVALRLAKQTLAEEKRCRNIGKKKDND